jgi:hypothetical protein
MTAFSSFQTDPSTLLHARRWYPIANLATLFGVPSFVAEEVFGCAGATTGADALRIIALDAGRLKTTGMTAATVAAFQSLHPSY